MDESRMQRASKDLNMNENRVDGMNEAEKKLFALFVAELMKNKIITDGDLLGIEDNIGEYEMVDEKGMVEIGPIIYDPFMADPPTRVRNVLEKDERERKRRRSK